jgi:hypothetical protein
MIWPGSGSGTSDLCCHSSVRPWGRCRPCGDGPSLMQRGSGAIVAPTTATTASRSLRLGLAIHHRSHALAPFSFCAGLLPHGSLAVSFSFYTGLLPHGSPAVSFSFCAGLLPRGSLAVSFSFCAGLLPRGSLAVSFSFYLGLLPLGASGVPSLSMFVSCLLGD